MTLHQGEAFAILACMLALFASDKVRYDLVGGIALVAAALTGIVPPGKVFEGFSNPVIIIIASVLVLSRAIAISGVVEAVIRSILGKTNSLFIQLGVLTASVAGLSAFMKNVGTLGIFMPIAIQTAQRSNRLPSLYLMPLAFGSLIGGTMTLIGTGPNLLISTVRQEIEGKPFRLFDFTAVGLPLTIVGVLFISVGWRLIPKNRRGRTAAGSQFEIETYTSEATVPPDSPMVGRTVEELEAMGDGSIEVTSIIRDHGRRYIPSRHWTFFPGDILVFRADPVTLKPVIDEARLLLDGAGQIESSPSKDDAIENVEAVITADSAMVGQSTVSLHLRQRYEVAILALSRGGKQIHTRLTRTDFQAGDVVVLQGLRETLPEALVQLGCLPLADRGLGLGQKRPGILPIAILVIVMIAIATQLVSADVAFFAGALLVVLLRLVSPKEAYDAIDWPIIVMLGSLIPVGEALKSTGASALIGDGLTRIALHLPGPLALGLVLVASMLVTPFLHHAAAVLVMGPVAAILARDLGYRIDPFLMAVALGASCDFLSPIGHQNNALVMGPGGYRFGDYWRLGLPLSAIVAVLGTALICIAWPLH